MYRKHNAKLSYRCVVARKQQTVPRKHLLGFQPYELFQLSHILRARLVPYLKLFHYNNERRIRLLQLSFEWNRQIIDFEDFLQVFPEHLDFRFLIDGKLHENDDVGGESFHDLPEEEENVRLNLIKMFNRPFTRLTVNIRLVSSVNRLHAVNLTLRCISCMESCDN
jgi:hypothetical protein